MPDLLPAALDLASAGLRVFPLRPGAKLPAIKGWPEHATTDPTVITRWWSRPWPSPGEPNIGIATGDGLAVVDIDPRHGGIKPSELPATLTARTPSGGEHHYYLVDGPVPNSVGRLAPGVDVRGERGLVVAPPSVTPAGSYAWVDPQVGIAVLDAGRLTAPEVIRARATGTRDHPPFCYRDDVPVGERNDYLARLAGYRYACGDSCDEVTTELHAEAQRLGFAPDRPDEIDKIARSIERYHLPAL